MDKESKNDMELYPTQKEDELNVDESVSYHG